MCRRFSASQFLPDVRAHGAETPLRALEIWQAIVAFFNDGNVTGQRVTETTLRRELSRRGLALKCSPSYAGDIATLQAITTGNLQRLREHTVLAFGPNSKDVVHIERKAESTALLHAAERGHLLLTGEPGCGKSGMIYDLVAALQVKSTPVVLLLAEDIFDQDTTTSTNLPDVTHALDDVLANWPDGAKGYLVTDALDAVRDGALLERLRRLLLEVKGGSAKWTVVASVREYDLKHGRKLRESFPGAGIEGFTSRDFSGVAHFHLGGLTEAQLDSLAARRTEIRPFIESARLNPRSCGLHRSPFYLRLAAELLRDGVSPGRVADWNSPAVLLRRFWANRVEGGPHSDACIVALRTLCQRIVETKRMALSAKELTLSAAELAALRELKGRGILRSPSLSAGDTVNDDEVRFTHHLLHDYAIAKVLIPETPEAFCNYAAQNPLLPVFYRQSFLFALEELWDADVNRETFWRTALAMEGLVQMHALARILAPLLAARRVEHLADLSVLLAAIKPGSDADSSAIKTVGHLAAGADDASAAQIQGGRVAWAQFCEKLAHILPAKPTLEGPLVNTLSALLKKEALRDAVTWPHVNFAARALLVAHLTKPVGQGWRWLARTAIEILCRTYSSAPGQTKQALLSLMAQDRLAQFPFDDLWELAHQLEQLGDQELEIVTKLFEAAFSAEPEPGQWREGGSAIMSLRFQTSDDWNGIHYLLAGYFDKLSGEHAAFMTDAACIAWNAVPRRRNGRRSRESILAGSVNFRGVACDLPEDYSHIWGREFEHEESRILSHFETVLRGWASNGDIVRLNDSVDAFIRRNQTSYMWTVFLEIGAENPITLGSLLAPVLAEKAFLSHSDYAQAGVQLFGALHRTGTTETRNRLEQLVLELPDKIIASEKENSQRDTATFALRCQNRLLGALEESLLVSETVRQLWKSANAQGNLLPNPKRVSPKVTSRPLTDAELIRERGVDLEDPANRRLFELREKLKSFLGRDGQNFDQEKADTEWALIDSSEEALAQFDPQSSKMAQELWGHLVGVVDQVAAKTNWPKTDPRWTTIRRLLLRGAIDPIPSASDYPEEKDDGFIGWGWPAPRVDAAQGLPFLVDRTGNTDPEVAVALRALVRDRTWPVRFNAVTRLAVLYKAAPQLMWELLDSVIESEIRYSVLNACLDALNRLWGVDADKVMTRVRRIAVRAEQAPPGHTIHDSLGNIYLFQYLRSGREECLRFVEQAIEHCEQEQAYKTLLPQLHELRVGGWMTAGSVDPIQPRYEGMRVRAWQFLGRLLDSAQSKLADYRAQLFKIHSAGIEVETQSASLKPLVDHTAKIVDGIAMQLFFASGAFDEKRNNDQERMTPEKLPRFWREAAPLIDKLANEPHPHTAHHLIQMLHHLMSCAPREVFLLATKSILSSSAARIQFEHLAVTDVVKLIQRALVDYAAIFQDPSDSKPIEALLAVLDLFVEAGWAEARALTHRLEEINR